MARLSKIKNQPCPCGKTKATVRTLKGSILDGLPMQHTRQLKVKECCGNKWLWQERCVKEAVDKYALTNADLATDDEKNELVQHIMADEELTKATIQFLLGGR